MGIKWWWDASLDGEAMGQWPWHGYQILGPNNGKYEWVPSPSKMEREFLGLH